MHLILSSAQPMLEGIQHDSQVTGGTYAIVAFAEEQSFCAGPLSRIVGCFRSAISGGTPYEIVVRAKLVDEGLGFLLGALTLGVGGVGEMIETVHLVADEVQFLTTHFAFFNELADICGGREALDL
jgi:hypothetical protein